MKPAPAPLRMISRLCLLVFGVAVAARAQQPVAETIRGHVTNDSGHVVAAATVIVTRGPDRLSQHTTTDSAGNYRVVFQEGTGDYLVYVASPGYKSARRRVQRAGSEHELVADFVLTVDVTKLAAQKVTAAKPERANNSVSPFQPDPGSAEKWTDGVNGQLPPTIAGDLGAIAGTLPNVTVTPGGASILGSSPSSTLMTLNGVATGAMSIPRAARVQSRVTGATYDATRGGFSGANVDVRLSPGNRNYQERNAYFTFDPPSWQFTDAASRALGATSGGFRGSAGANGELIRDAFTYNTSIDFAHNASDPVTLLDAGADALLRAGASPDSVAQLRAMAEPLGLPLSGAGVPGDRLHDAFTLLSRFDDTRDSLNRHTLTTYAGYTTDGAMGFNALAAPSAAGQRTQKSLGATWQQDNFVGPGQRVLTETTVSASLNDSHTTPYRRLPGVSVLVRNPDADGGQDVTGLTLGGLASTGDDRNWFAEAGNRTIWMAGGRKHRFQALAWGRLDGLRQDAITNGLGTYSFASLADFAANRPSSFNRTLTQPERSGSTWNSALAFSHTISPSRFFNFIYGGRLEADGFTSAPTANPALEQALGVRTGAAPSRLHFSPRVGFNYTYNRDRENGAYMMTNNIGTFYSTMTGTVRGGIGEFRDMLQPGVLAQASAATGLAGGTTTLSCVGPAVPAPDWSRFAADPTTVPTQCANGGGVLSELAPSVSLIDPSYDVPRSWRTSLDWSSSFGKVLVQAGVLGSYDLNQPGTVDANFSGARKLTLASEGNRPVFVSNAAIDTASGAVSAAEARRSDQFGRVGMRVSDLKGYGGQFTLRIAPDQVRLRGRAFIYTSLGYTLQGTRRQFRGFDGAAFGDPRQIEWAAGPNDARHIFVLTGGYADGKIGALTLFARAQSGLPFTPIVQGDVNGDGLGGGRAYVPVPGSSGDARLDAQLRALLASGSSTARDCVAANLGQVVARNGCRGPWTQTLNLQWTPVLPARLRSRLRPTVYFQNVLGGVDQLLHGSDNLRGWGSTMFPNPVLLVPRGFDPSAERFRYDVNARFGDTRSSTVLLNPFKLVVDFSLDLTVNPDLQQLRRAVEPVRGPTGWVRRSVDSLEAFYLSRTSSLYKAILDQSDSLFLSASQTKALQRADSAYSAEVRAIYRPLAEYLAGAEGGAGKAQLDSVTAAQKTYWKVFWAQPEIADTLITPAQKDLFPMIKNIMTTEKKSRENMRWMFGYPVTLGDKPPAVRPTGS